MKPRQRHRPVLGRDAHRTRVHLGVPVELPHHRVAHSNIGLGKRCSCHGALLSRTQLLRSLRTHQLRAADVIDDAQNALDLTDDGFRLGLFARPQNSAGQGHRALIDMHKHVLRNSRVIIERFPGCREDVGSRRCVAVMVTSSRSLL